ncbi:hypothetical protein [Rickettsia endosymbiont of Oedothorax gibbosus]|uniref:hypothetical protein n=1 Tax=Rickettsia endosymbiont of Oedothorax gibbosus TaxID=931099 RepID=UPI0020258209|nr:hypothetical protein [Rickettsia endosymbiont of Oedothorax gibbosus]
MTESLIFPDGLAENSDTIFYNIVSNFVPPEWRNLTNNCGKQLSKTSRQLLSLIVSRLQIYQKDKLSEELQEGYHFFEKELGVCQKRVKQCLTELQTSGFIDHSLITTIKHNLKCRNILCIRILKKFISFRKANDNSYYSDCINIQYSHKNISLQPEKNYHSTVKKSKKNTSIYISIISKCGKKDCFCGQNCGQSLPDLESTKEPSFNLPLEITISSGGQSSSELNLDIA